MSFLRREAADALLRWAEPALVGGALGLAAWFAGVWLLAGSPFGWLALLVAALLGLWLRAALAGALAQPADDGPGIVVLREGEVGYMSPEGGGFLDLAALERVEIARPSRGPALWFLDAGRSGRLIFPANAEGAEHVVEALSALPGFSDLAAAQALNDATTGRRLLWERAPSARLPGR